MGISDGRTWEQRLADAIRRMEARLDRSGDCWLWPGSTNGRYGMIVVKTGEGRRNRCFYVHRLMYEAHVGPIPEGMEVDHLCSVLICANPAHLEAVTPAENSRRRGARTTHCPRGHAYDDVNTSLNGGKRVCLTCRAEAKWLARHPGQSLDERRARGRYARA